MEVFDMARKVRKDNSKLREMIQEYGIKDLKDVQEFVKMLTAETIQAALDAECFLQNRNGQKCKQKSPLLQVSNPQKCKGPLQA
jgi:23S rRNA A2030 N6-methylase RlmJ